MFTPKPDEKLKPLTINLSGSELEEIERLALKYGCKKPGMIRQLIQYFIEQESKEVKPTSWKRSD